MKTVKTDAKNSVEWEALSSIISKAKRTLVLTGAGISVSGYFLTYKGESQTFEATKGCTRWSRTDIQELLSREVIFSMPRSLRIQQLQNCSTRLCHSSNKYLVARLTQNIDKATPTRTHEFINDLGTKGKLVYTF